MASRTEVEVVSVHSTHRFAARASAGGFAVLIPLLAVKGTAWADDWVLPALAGATLMSLLIWLATSRPVAKRLRPWATRFPFRVVRVSTKPLSRGEVLQQSPARALEPGLPARGRPSSYWQVVVNALVEFANELEYFAEEIEAGEANVENYSARFRRQADATLKHVAEYVPLEDGERDFVRRAETRDDVLAIAAHCKKRAISFASYMQEPYDGKAP